MHVKRRSLARIRAPAETRVSAGTRVRAADAPKALKGRAARRAWAAEYNRALRATGDQEVARKAGAKLAVAAIDIDAGIAAHVKKSGPMWTGNQSPPYTLPQAVKRRGHNVDGAGDRIVGAILRDEASPFTAADRRQEAQKRHGSRSFIRGKALPE